MSEKVLSNIKFDFNFEVFSNKINLKKFKSMEAEVRKFIDNVVSVVQPKAIYRVAYIDQRLEHGLIIDNVKFNSNILKENLEKIERVFPFIATCGQEMEAMIKKETDPLKQYWFDQLKEMALASAVKHMQKQIKNKYKIEKISSMNPGSADKEVWPLEQQQQLFSLFDDVEKEIGVKLTDSYLMQPNKSVSGIYFPVDENFINCEYCTRENCPSRRAPHNAEKWEQ